MTTGTIGELNAIRRQYGCESDANGNTQKFAAAWSKKVLSGEIKLPDHLALPPCSETCPKNAPLLNLLQKKLAATKFDWSLKEIPRKRGGSSRCVQFSNYPGADRGSMLTLADLWILPVETIDAYVSALRSEHQKVPSKTKRRAPRREPYYFAGGDLSGGVFW